jgi:DNA (cytosine-5)-methyltransferase 1
MATRRDRRSHALGLQSLNGRSFPLTNFTFVSLIDLPIGATSDSMQFLGNFPRFKNAGECSAWRYAETNWMATRKYVDLFAGCGGLSLGLEKAGFELSLAVEKSDMAAETFFHNLVEQITDPLEWLEFSAVSMPVEKQAMRKLVVRELSAVLESKTLLGDLKGMGVDLVAGGPPCQGFSLAGRRNPDDVRNQLPWQFLEFVAAVQPKSVLIENVSGMAQDFNKHGKSSPFNDLRIALSETAPGYVVQPLLLNAMHFGVPQHRPRVMLVGVRRDIASRLDLAVSEEIWRSEYDFTTSRNFSQRPSLAPRATHFGNNLRTVRDAIADLSKGGYSSSNEISDFALEMRSDNDWGGVTRCAERSPSKVKNHVLRRHAARIEMRFRLYQYLRDQNIYPRLLGIPKDENLTEQGKKIAIAAELADAAFPALGSDGTVIAENLTQLVDRVMELGTKKHSQRPLKWTAPSPTVVSLPDDYVHPTEPRTLTVRELARFQSFPDAFEFRAKETTGSLRRRVEVPQYTQVGNAVPPKLAEAVGRHIMGVLARA